ncbi:UDP-galactose transporter 1-like [Hordeum vulgare]|nr:UDP-galactose transporter 1-like [Hordeum vulgare]
MESAGGVGGLGSMRAVLAILQWWGFNVYVIIINKWIFQKLDFKFPLTVSCIHFICSSIRAYVAIHVFKAKPLIQVEPEDRWKRIFPMSFVFCMNIVLGNVSLRYIPVSFMQTIKSFTPATTGATICMHQFLDLYMLVMQWDTGTPSYAQFIPVGAIFSPILLLQVVAVLFAAWRFFERLVIKLQDGILESLPAMVGGVYSEDNNLQLEATTQFRKLLSIERSPPIEEVIQSGVVPRFVQFLTREDFPQLQGPHSRDEALSTTSSEGSGVKAEGGPTEPASVPKA